MKCVVTGASGHIGNVLVRDLINKKYEVKAFVLKNENVDYLKKLNVEICYGDVRDLESLKNAFRGADIVFHLAGIIDIGTVNKKFIYSINVDGTKNVLQACREEKVKKLVYTSSVHAIPEKPKEEVITEITEFSENKVTFWMKDNRGTHFVEAGLDCWIHGKTSMTGGYLHHQSRNNNSTSIRCNRTF